MEPEPETKVLAAGPADAATASALATVDPMAMRRAVGRYELVQRLGHGGMATVYLGRATGNAGFEKLVAIKVIHPHLAAEPEFVEMFLEEARIAAKIQSPHVAGILDLGHDDGLHFMVMEYIDGETLSGLLRQLRPTTSACRSRSSCRSSSTRARASRRSTTCATSTATPTASSTATCRRRTS
jgi:serine/threonine protein kinase